jgi:hypothetical protein
MKEKNWLTWLTVLALVVGFAAMGTSVWLSAQAAKQTQRNSQLYQASWTSSSEASSVKKRLEKLASDNSSLKKKNSRLAKENRALKEANQEASAAAGLNVWETEEKSGQLQLEIDNQTGQVVSDLLVLAVAASGRVTLSGLPSYFPVGGAKPRYFYRKEVAIGKTEGSLTSAYAGSDLVCLCADASGVYWFKGNRRKIEKIGSQAHFKKLLRQISLNKLEESPLLVKKTKTEKKKTSKKTTKKAENQSSKKKAE